MSPTVLFTHLKIILLQCFQFQFSISVKISSIQTDSKSQSLYSPIKKNLYDQFIFPQNKIDFKIPYTYVYYLLAFQAATNFKVLFQVVE